ncbi:uncharacterized protein LOC110769400 [Prunus avium]|uniref:Uncharacterized protein LOC110769400 n=1 Tax=Prunus avium TaxID=42229 RepID=A0A6P5TQ05_PRUAV|nr:uncharacterized protein LOC110769400 [Prunus avium]
MEGIVVGILIGIPEGKLGNGGNVTLGIVGIVGKLGSGGSCVVGLGSDGWLIGKFGKVGCGSVGRGGKGGSVEGGLGNIGGSVEGGLGNVGAPVCKRLRPATVTWMLDEHKITKIAKKQYLQEAIGSS